MSLSPSPTYLSQMEWGKRDPIGLSSAPQGIWKRRVAVYKQMGDTQKAVEDLCAYVDTFYTDVEGWLELAELYAGVNS